MLSVSFYLLWISNLIDSLATHVSRHIAQWAKTVITTLGIDPFWDLPSCSPPLLWTNWWTTVKLAKSTKKNWAWGFTGTEVNNSDIPTAPTEESNGWRIKRNIGKRTSNQKGHGQKQMGVWMQNQRSNRKYMWRQTLGSDGPKSESLDLFNYWSW